MGLLAKFTAASLKAKVAITCAAAATIGTAAVVTGTIISQEDVYRVLKVFEMSGSSVVSRESVGELDAYVGMNLESGDLLSVGEESKLRLALDNDKYILLDQGTVMKLNAEGDRNDSKTSIELRQGTILNEITKPLSANSTYEVSTPKATMAVRGTSFVVSVDENNDGSYTIDVSALNGKVEAVLLDSKGTPTDKKVTIGIDQRATIQTNPNKETGNPATVDGFSSFVYKDKDGNITEVSEGENPVYDINYDSLSENVKTYALNSNETNLMVLDSIVVSKLMGEGEDGEQTSETSATEAPVTEETSFSSESATEAPVTEETSFSSASVTEASSYTPAATTYDIPVAVAEIAYLPVSETSVPESNSITEYAVSETVPSVSETSVPETSSTDLVSTETEVTPSEENTLQTLSSDTPTEAETLSEASSTTVTYPAAPPAPSPVPVFTETTTAVSEEITETTVTEAKKFTVSFMNGTELVHSEQVDAGNAVLFVPDISSEPGKSGSWSYNGAKFDPSMSITGDIVVNAVYSDIICTVTFNDAARNELKTVKIIYGHTVAESDFPVVTVPAGKKELHWNNDKDDSEFTSSTIITSDTDVTAEFVNKEFTVTMTDAKGAATEYYFDNDESFGESGYEMPEAGTGYKWVSNGEKFTDTTPVTGNMTVRAEPIPVTVTFIGTDSDELKIELTYNQTVAASGKEMPVAGAGYKWVSDGEKFTDTTPVKGDITVKAEKKPIKVTFKNKSGEYYFDSGEKFNGSEYEMPGADHGNVWLIDENDVNTEFTADTEITRTLNLTAVGVSTYTIKNKFAADEVVKEGKCINGTTITLTPSTTVSGKSFAGWGKVTSGNYTGYDNLDPSGSITLTPNSGWDSMEFRAVYKSTATVKWNNPDGTTIKTDTHEIFTDNDAPSKFYISINDAPTELSEKYENIYYTAGESKKELTTDSVPFSGDVTFTAENLRGP